MVMQTYILIFIILISQFSFANPNPKFSFEATMPTSLSINAYKGATAQYRLTNNTKLTRTLTLVPIEGISQLSNTPGSCASPFTLTPNASCLLNLYIPPAESISSSFFDTVVCKTKGNGDNTPSIFLCSQPSYPDILEIQASSQVQPRAIILNYATPNSDVTICNIDPATGLLVDASCTATLVTNLKFSIGVAVNRDNTKAFITSSGNNLIFICDISSTDNTLKNCTSFSDPAFSGPQTIIFNQDYSRIYVANYTGNTITHCDTDVVNGIITNCTNQSSGLTQTTGATFNSGYNKLYIKGLGSANPIICDINTANGNLENCTKQLSVAITGQSIVFNAKNTLAYIAYINKLTVCEVNASSGELQACVTQNLGSGTAINNAINWPATKFYLSNLTAGITHLTICDLDQNNTAVNCVPSGTNMAKPLNVVLLNY